MGETKMKLNLLRKLYVDELKDLYSAENQLIKALPKMAKATDSEELRTAFEEHLKQTQEHASRLEKVFAALEESPKGKKCKGMEGLIEEGSEMIEEGLEPAELDAGLIAAAQRVEHYEIAGYGCVRTYASLLGETSAVSLLEKTLAEEKATDEKLTEISEQINAIAAEAEEGKLGSSGRKTKPGDTARAARV
jgi:ferritin-like metal-binding protein YciE